MLLNFTSIKINKFKIPKTIPHGPPCHSGRKPRTAVASQGQHHLPPKPPDLSTSAASPHRPWVCVFMLVHLPAVLSPGGPHGARPHVLRGSAQMPDHVSDTHSQARTHTHTHTHTSTPPS